MNDADSLHGIGSRRGEFLRGIRDQLPILIGVIPFGMIFGALAVRIGLQAFEAQSLSLLVFAGSAQFIAIGLIAEGVPALIIVMTIWVVNLRHALYSAHMAPHFSGLSWRWKWVLSWLLTDEAFVVGSSRYTRGNTTLAHWYFLGTGLALWSAWQISTLAGILLGTGLPDSLSLEFALPMTFLALLLPSMTHRPSLLAASSAGLAAVLLAGLPYKLGILLSALLGIGVGMVWERRQGPANRREEGPRAQ